MTLLPAGIRRDGWRGALLLLLLALAAPMALAAPDYPALSGRVVDQAGLLDGQSQSALDAELAQHEAKTGEQVVVVTVDSLQGESIEEYGVGLGRHWGIGTSGEDNGALLIVAPNEREVRIEVGYGLEGKLTDALIGQIVQNEILPRFRADDMAGGIVAGAESVLAVLEGSYVPGEWSVAPAPGNGPELPVPDWAIPFLFFGVWLLFVLVIRRRRRRGLGIGGPMIGGAGLGGLGGRNRGGASRGGFSGRGGSFGGGGATGRW